MQDTKKEGDKMKNTMKKPINIPVEKLRPFAGHPFKVKDDEEMNTLIESVQTQGILTPLIIRPIEITDEYEVVSGHRRLHAAQKAGITEAPALIYALDRDAAAIAVVDSNLYREHILPSEKAFAYKLKRDAIAHQGRTSPQLGEKSLTVEKIGVETGDSKNQVLRYIRLTHLIPELLDLMDEGKIALMVGEALSYLGDKEQYAVLEQCEVNDCTPSYAQAVEMKKGIRMEISRLVILAKFSPVKRQIRGKPLKSQPKNYGNTHRTLMRNSLRILSSKPVSITVNS